MISILVSFFPFIFIIYYFIILNNTESISSKLKSGQLCYSCKSELEINLDKLLRILIKDENNYLLCKSCEREEKLDGLINSSKTSNLHKFKLLLINNKFDKTLSKLIMIMIFLLFVDISLKILYDIKWFSYIYNIFITVYWSLIIYRQKLTSIKKPLE